MDKTRSYPDQLAWPCGTADAGADPLGGAPKGKLTPGGATCGGATCGGAPSAVPQVAAPRQAEMDAARHQTSWTHHRHCSAWKLLHSRMAEPQPQRNSKASMSTEHLNPLTYCIGSNMYKPREQTPSKLATGARLELVLGNKLVLPKGLCKMSCHTIFSRSGAILRASHQ